MKNTYLAECVNDIPHPALLFNGEKDEKVSHSETDKMFGSLNGAKKLVLFPAAAHENYLKKYKNEWLAQCGLHW